MRQQDPQQALQDSKLITLLPEEARAEFVAKCKVRVYEPRECIVSKGDSILGPTWVEQGLASVTVPQEHGKPYSFGYNWPGEAFVGTLSGLQEWGVDVRAIARTMVVSLPRSVHLEIGQRSTATTLALLSTLIVQLLRRQLWITELHSVRLRPRLLKLLGRLSDELGTATPEGSLLDFPLTHGILTCATLTSQDETARAMRDLEAWGYFKRLPRHRILISDRRRLNTTEQLGPEE